MTRSTHRLTSVEARNKYLMPIGRRENVIIIFYLVQAVPVKNLRGIYFTRFLVAKS
jgi:hypothetical protein